MGESAASDAVAAGDEPSAAGGCERPGTTIPPMFAARDLTAASGAFTLGPLSFSIAAGEYVLLTGPVGAGKSTLLRALLGLVPASGSVVVGDRDYAGADITRRPFGWVPQDAILVPQQTVAEQWAFIRSLPARSGTPGDDRPLTEIAADWRVTAGLDQTTEQLSGGQRQQVAIVRALVSRPAMLLLDEPFSAQPTEQRRWLQSRVRQWASERGVPVLHVTHAVEEATTQADRAIELVDGQFAAE